jgi:hypothetical protein
MIPDREKPGGFVVTGEKRRSLYLPAGRALIEGENLVVYLDGIGRYQMNPVTARYILLLGGSVPFRGREGEQVYAERRNGGKGLWVCRGEERYVIPARSLLPVLAGKTRKAAVFRYESPTRFLMDDAIHKILPRSTAESFSPASPKK